MFFLYALTLVLISGWASGFVEFSQLTRVLYGLAAIIFLAFSYVAFDRVEGIDFFDFISGMVFTGELRKYPHGKAVDIAAAQLYFGLALIGVVPVIVKVYGDPSVAAGFLTLGGLLVATGVAGYVLSGKAR